MPSNKDPQLNDVAILTRAVENVFRKLIRFLVGRISLVKLQEIIRVIYVQESEMKLKVDRPEKNISMTKLAVLTGLDTRTLTKVRNNEDYWKPFHKAKRFLREMTPESSILDVWSSDPRFLDKKSGNPKQLKFSDAEISFELVVKEAVSSRGVTAQSLLEKLIDNQSVKYHEKSNKIELIKNIDMATESSNSMKALELGFIKIETLLGTIFHNYRAISKGTTAFYERGYWTHRLNPNNRQKFETAMRKFLKTSNKRARQLIAEFEEDIASEDQLTAGVNMFYFEDAAGTPN